MKKRNWKLLSIFAACILTAMCLTACGADDGQKDGSSPTGDNGSGQQGLASSQGNNGEQAGYLFKANGVTIGVDMNMNELLSGLGEAKSVFEAPSCAAQGTAYVYNYTSFEIETYPDGENNLIAFIILKDDMVATSEGIDLSKTKADVIKAYGDGYKEDGNRLTYEKDGMKLNFIFEGENIKSIEYVSGAVM